jgi:curli biogenesis system outer membrane secretion channel CsgG
MKRVHITSTSQVVEREWVSFPGGELQAPRPTVLCPACRAKVQASAVKPARQSNQPLCFACYRANMERERALKAAGELNTASEARFQSTLPFEPVNRSRLARLQSERAVSRVAARSGVGQYVDKRRQAQIAARSVLERIVIGLRERNATSAERDRVRATATHAAELQLPEAWLPFVMSR